ncbi:uncharacterized protein LOC123537998 [Mercenaria mercenaria]|uniref:uncharacterized protein LOC123537998 n=1 Tax=Mercenaria mercenaria TaxID=6596 RepID=UPI00234E7B3C|nr:uncharacterized protein LOC123537998 [Mercenaria mercenaria]
MASEKRYHSKQFSHHETGVLKEMMEIKYGGTGQLGQVWGGPALPEISQTKQAIVNFLKESASFSGHPWCQYKRNRLYKFSECRFSENEHNFKNIDFTFEVFLVRTLISSTEEYEHFAQKKCTQTESNQINCEDVGEEAKEIESEWPVGKYAIPMSRYGCPESYVQGWREGHLSVRWRNPHKVYVDSRDFFGFYDITDNHDEGLCTAIANTWVVEETVYIGQDLNGTRTWTPANMTRFQTWCFYEAIKYSDLKEASEEEPINEINCRIGSDKWTLLYSGGLSCLYFGFSDTWNKTFEFLFLRDTEGRFISLFVSLWSTRILEDVSYIEVFTKHVQYDSSGSCNIDLGMAGREITDGSISASSEVGGYLQRHVRPYSPGWCAADNDMEPYIQVDLHTATVVEGITIYNWKDKMLGPDDVLEMLFGAYAFKISFKIRNQTGLSEESEIFYVDTSKSITVPQTFWFTKKMKTDSLTVSILQPLTEGLKCLRFELLGCKITDGYKIVNRMTNFKRSDDEVVSFVNEIFEDFMPMSSLGYPERHGGQIYMWIISLPKHRYIKLRFKDIKLGYYRDEPSYNCNDTITISPDLYGIGKGRVIDYTFVLRQYYTLSVETRVSRLVMIYSTCALKSSIYLPSETAGFSATLKSEHVPACFSLQETIPWHLGLKETCNQQAMILTSMSYLGFQFSETSEEWTIHVPLHQIHLEIFQFSIICPRDGPHSLFKIIDVDKENTYCNFDRPPNLINSSYDRLVISFYKATIPTYIQPGHTEGFRMLYTSSMNKMENLRKEHALFSEVKNVALGKPAIKSSMDLDFRPWTDTRAAKATDGIVHQELRGGSCFLTSYEYEPWWMVDLQGVFKLEYIVLYKRMDCCETVDTMNIPDYGEDKETTNVQVSTGLSIKKLHSSGYICVLSPVETIDQSSIVARYVRLTVLHIWNRLSLCEVQVYGKLVSNVAANKPTYSSSELYFYSETYDNSRAVGGLYRRECFVSKREFQPWWMVDLQGVFILEQAVIHPAEETSYGDPGAWQAHGEGASSRTDDIIKYYKYLHNLEISSGMTLCDMEARDFECLRQFEVAKPIFVPLLGITARFIKIQIVGRIDELKLCEIEIYGQEVGDEPNSSDSECSRNNQSVAIIGDICKVEFVFNIKLGKCALESSTLDTEEKYSLKQFAFSLSVLTAALVPGQTGVHAQANVEMGSGQEHARVVILQNTMEEEIVLGKRKNIFPSMTVWNYARYGCWRKQMQLVSIFSIEELRFIKTLLRERRDLDRGITYDLFNASFYAYIGLRFVNSDIEHIPVWENQVLAHFQAWRNGEPSIRACTRMNFRSFSDDNTWESIDCDVVLADYSICEYQLNSPNHDMCQSHEAFHCDILRCIPKRLKCDNYMDCKDGSDEDFCGNEEYNSCKEWWNAGYRQNGKYLIVTDYLSHIKGELPCAENGQTFPVTQKCIYDVDDAGFPLGCRDGSHLTNCENFSCPNDTVKCPGSFCLPVRFVCDGDINCERGQDEENCGCESSQSEILILYEKRTIEELLIRSFSRQFYTPTNIVRILSFEASKPLKSFDIDGTQVIVTDRQVDQRGYTTRLPECSYKVMSKDFLKSVKFTKNGTKGIIYIQNSQTSKEVADDMFTNLHYLTGEYKLYRVTQSSNTDYDNVVPRVIPVRVRRWKTLNAIGAEFFSSLCKVHSVVHCQDQYKCASSKTCLPMVHVCDGYRHCVHGDDELLCGFECPNKCVCSGLAVHCKARDLKLSYIDDFPKATRELDLSLNKKLHSVLQQPVLDLILLSILNLSGCDIKNLSRHAFHRLRNLQLLDISYNLITVLPERVFSSLTQLKTLHIHSNIYLSGIDPYAFHNLFLIRDLNLANMRLTKVSAKTFAGLKLKSIDLSNNRIEQMEPFSFSNLSVNKINFERNNIKSFNKDTFTGVTDLQILITPSFKFCCIRPNYVAEHNCVPTQDEFSSCEDLMRHSVLQFLLWLIGLMALLGNGLSLIYRLKVDRKRLKLSYGIFVTNLAAADLLMGVYLVMIAVADAVFRKRYIYVDEKWRGSFMCNLAGVLSTISSECSVFFLCLITLDRLLVIKYPFGTKFFTTKKSVICVTAAWLISSFIAILPVVYEGYFQNKFYSRSGVCIALPLTRDRPPGWVYSILVFVVFNFITFLLVAIGQWTIFYEMQKSSGMATTAQSSRKRDLKVARNLLLVVATDFMCWFPIGVMGVIALSGHAISGDVYAWAAVFILPVNSALNPILYTLTAIIAGKDFQPSTEEHLRVQKIKGTS